MNAPIDNGGAAAVHRFEGLRGRLPGAGLTWLAALRESAALAFGAAGYPTRRLEAWHYTDLSGLAGEGFAEPLTAVDEAPVLPPMHGAARAVFVDGRFRGDLSTLEGLGYVAAGLGGALPVEAGTLGALARPGEHPMAALNTMLFEDGLTVAVPAGVDGGVLDVVSLASAGARPTAFHPRYLVTLGEGARLTLIESASGPAAARYLHNAVWEVSVAAGARLMHARIQQESLAAWQVSTTYAAVAGGGVYDSFVLNAGARLARNEIHARLDGPHAACHLNGAQLLGRGQHADTTTELDHAAPDCASRQTYKTVLAGRARGVFQGRILVRQVAQRTDGYQMNQALLLSPDAEIDSKPQLEIYADDVKCSHGATVGELDDDMLFYLRARGIPAATARTMLVEAFLQEAVDAVADAAVRGALEHALAAWWLRQEAA